MVFTCTFYCRLFTWTSGGTIAAKSVVQIGTKGASLSVVPRLDMTNKVYCTLLVYLLGLPTHFCGGTCPGAPWSHQERGSCNWTLAERRYQPSSVHRGITSFCLESVAVTAPFLFAPLPVFCVPPALIVNLVQQRVVFGRSMVVASRLTSRLILLMMCCSKLFGASTPAHNRTAHV